MGRAMTKHSLVKKGNKQDPSYVLMNKNVPAKKYKAGQRTQRNLRFVVSGPASGSETTHTIDIAQCLSAINRRAYSQQAYYYVSKITVHNSGTAWVRATTLPDNWVTLAAYKRARRIYYEQLSRTLRNGDINIRAIGKYHDFRVGINASHDFLNNELPVDYLTSPGAGDSFTVDEWTQSQVVSGDPVGATSHNGVEYTLHMLGGATGNQIGLIQSYASTRPYPQNSDPQLLPDFDTDVLSMMFNDGDTMDEVLDNLDQEYDEPPYNRDLYPGEDNNHMVVQAQCATGDGSGEVAYTGPLCVPLGLLRMVVRGTGDAAVGSIEINVELTPGPYKGVYAERIE